MTPKEYQVLMVLYEAGDAIVTREKLLERVWGFSCDVNTRRVDFQIDELREKLEENPSQPRHIITVRGTGYRLIL